MFALLSEVQKYFHFLISKDKTHDTLFVQHCFMLHYSWLKQHKKGEHDGGGVVVKQTLTCEQLLIVQQCTANAMNFLRDTCSHGAPSTSKEASS